MSCNSFAGNNNNNNNVDTPTTESIVLNLAPISSQNARKTLTILFPSSLLHNLCIKVYYSLFQFSSHILFIFETIMSTKN